MSRSAVEAYLLMLEYVGHLMTLIVAADPSATRTPSSSSLYLPAVCCPSWSSVRHRSCLRPSPARAPAGTSRCLHCSRPFVQEFESCTARPRLVTGQLYPEQYACLGCVSAPTSSGLMKGPAAGQGWDRSRQRRGSDGAGPERCREAASLRHGQAGRPSLLTPALLVAYGTEFLPPCHCIRN